MKTLILRSKASGEEVARVEIRDGLAHFSINVDLSLRELRRFLRELGPDSRAERRELAEAFDKALCEPSYGFRASCRPVPVWLEAFEREVLKREMR